MGNKVSSGGGSVDAAAECAKVANAFAPAFVRAYGLAVVVQLRREQDLDNHGGAGSAASSGGAHLQYALERPPVATEPLESGWLIKLGEIKKSWRRRFFVAAEESDNFCVRYFEKESEAGDVRRAKGSIYLAGYVPRAISADEGFGEHVLALEPLDKRAKRTYYLRCDSEDQRQRWKLVLRLGSLKCAPPLSPEPAMAEAFKQAYARSRRAVGLGGYYVLDRPEQEQLAALCIEAVRAKIAAAAGGGADGGDASSASASAASGDASPAAAAAAAASSGGGTGPNRKSLSAAGGGAAATSGAGAGGKGGSGGAANAAAAAREAFEKEVARLAGEASTAAWVAASARVELRRDALQRRAGDSLPDITRAEEELRARLRGSIADYVSPLAQAAAAPLLPALLGALLKPLYKVGAACAAAAVGSGSSGRRAARASPTALTQRCPSYHNPRSPSSSHRRTRRPSACSLGGRRTSCGAGCASASCARSTATRGARRARWGQHCASCARSRAARWTRTTPATRRWRCCRTCPCR
jgi:hypothetical protein